MEIQEEIKKCVAFVALKMADDSFKVVGTAFFIGRDVDASGNTSTYPYVVTAKHVIKGIEGKMLDEAYIRINFKDGTLGFIITKTKDWIFHEDSNVDIAVHYANAEEASQFDHLLFPETGFADEEYLHRNSVGIGTPLFIAGLFKHHHGENRNLPIIRIGNIASMREENIQSREYLIDGYLIEARSIGGLSGSPVFLNPDLVRKNEEGEVQFEKNGRKEHRLFGIIHGHFDSKFFDVSKPSEFELINSGIAIVTPIEKLVEIFKQSKVVEIENTASGRESDN